jgi:hypothetical protein
MKPRDIVLEQIHHHETVPLPRLSPFAPKTNQKPCKIKVAKSKVCTQIHMASAPFAVILGGDCAGSFQPNASMMSC